MFSARLPADLRHNRLAQALMRVRDRGIPILDLTESNPTKVGISYTDDLADAFASRAALRYDPAPFGLPLARAAVSEEYGRRGASVPPARIVLAASTSEAYSLLFKLFCDPGDEVLVPAPSYPLFDYLTRLEGVRPVHYRLEYHGRWTVDLDSLGAASSERTRAIVLVNPNNPTGSFVHADDLEGIVAIARGRSVPIISDEVFGDYVFEPGAFTTALDVADVLAFTLGGLSKSAGLPQAKVAWMAAGGPEDLVREALVRLEIVCDSYLSVGSAAQHALPRLLAAGGRIRDQIAARVRTNYGRLRDIAARHRSCDVLGSEGGWYGVMQVPAVRSEETLVLALLEEDGVLVHPGYFFDFPREAFLVVSLLPHPAVFDQAIGRVLARVDRL
ncbi:MAG: pyridoxal phosphate-dependent aminotransferase [Acidobacteria bacterium]|nr:pyridoxal phosphate-dependent aminotransferase [Acidobacteriota bacterium]